MEVQVAVPRPLDLVFTYRLPEGVSASDVSPGTCVRIPFGRAHTHGFIVDLQGAAPEGTEIKTIQSIAIHGRQIPADVFELCKFASEYYLAPLGEVLGVAHPSALVSFEEKRARASVDSQELSAPVIAELTQAQSHAAERIWKGVSERQNPTFLLKGVTGSGKTEVYLEIARRMLAQGRSVLFLVPEIALTDHLSERVSKGLGVPVALWHSALAAGRRRELSERVRSGEIRVVLGARSAVFSPLHNLGLIVVDEEHDPSYKQEDRVRYHARDLALVRAKLTGASTILGSATPALESLERASEGRYELLELAERFGSAGKPEIQCVDLAQEPLVEGMQAPLAQSVLNELRAVLDSGQQAMVFLNRRGFAAFLLCEDCSWVAECPDCSISLTVYKRDHTLRCHVCGHMESVPEVCAKCTGVNLIPVGAGTESLEEQLPALLPQARILRLDRELITSQSRLEKTLSAFRRGEANLLLGTQMLVKGHDFPEVTLVVVVMADALFRWPDFRAPERALQVLTQVSGRAGRGDKKGRVLIQTYDPDHPVLKVILGERETAEFLSEERQLRQDLGYPPFGRMARLRWESSDSATAQSEATQAAQFVAAMGEQGLEVLGPSEAFLERAKNAYRWDLMLRSRGVSPLQKAMRRIKNASSNFKSKLWIDVDPYGV